MGPGNDGHYLRDRCEIHTIVFKRKLEGDIRAKKTTNRRQNKKKTSSDVKSVFEESKLENWNNSIYPSNVKTVLLGCISVVGLCG